MSITGIVASTLSVRRWSHARSSTIYSVNSAAARRPTRMPASASSAGWRSGSRAPVPRLGI